MPDLVVPEVTMNPLQGITAKSAAQMSAVASGYNFQDPRGEKSLVDQVIANLKAQNIEADPALVKSLVAAATQSGLIGKSGLVKKATDPV